MWPLFLVELLALVVAVVMLQRWLSAKGTPKHVHFTVFLGWFVSFSIVCLVPIDLGATFVRRCHANGVQGCPDVMWAINESILDGFWLFVYWTSQLFGWLLLPFQQSYVDAGDFTRAKRLRTALRENLLFYGIMLVVGGAFVTYLLIAVANDFASVMGVCMALSNAVSLLIACILCGYGFVEFPRELWKQGGIWASLKRLEFRAVLYHNSLDDAKIQFSSCMAELRQVVNATSIDHPNRDLVDLIVSEFPLQQESGSIQRYSGLDVNIYQELSLAKLRRRLRRSLVKLRKARSRWDRCVTRAFELEAVHDCSASGVREVRIPFDPNPPTKPSRVFLKWAWLRWIRPTIFRLLGIAALLLSLAIVGSEVYLFVRFLWGDTEWWHKANFSPLWLMVDNLKYGSTFVLQLCVFLPLAYICLCLKYGLFKLKILSLYEVVAKETEPFSLIFNAYVMSRLSAAVCFNFLNMIDEANIGSDPSAGTIRTVFAQNYNNMGEVPFIGTSYNSVLPPVIVLLCLGTLFNVGSRLKAWCKCFGGSLEFDEDYHADVVEEGRNLIAQEKRAKMRAQVSKESARSRDARLEEAPAPSWALRSKRQTDFTRLEEDDPSPVSSPVKPAKKSFFARFSGSGKQPTSAPLPAANVPHSEMQKWKDLEDDINNL